MNRPDQNIDELLSSFIDGELTDSQRADVERLIAYNPQVAQRLRQFQKIKMMVSSLPHVKSPREMVERIKASLAAEALSAEQPIYLDKRKGIRQLMLRRVVAVAAMIALVAVLGGVIYSILVPETASERATMTASNVKSLSDETAAVIFSGRLELKAGALPAVDAFINRAIEDNGLSDYVTKTVQPSNRLYSLNCSRGDLNSLLADLQGIWQRFGSATLYVDTERFNAPVVVNAVTAEQTAEIVNQDNPERSIEVAKDFAVLNNMAELMPGRQISAAIDNKGVDLIQIPKPVLTGGDRKKTEKTVTPESKRDVSLTIVVVGSE
jgi:hypothetical protein